MQYFKRALRYLIPEYKAILTSIFCALMVGLLVSLSITALLPLMKVILEDEGLHSWGYRSIIKHRSGATFSPILPAPAALTQTEQAPVGPVLLRVEKAKKAAYEQGFRPGDLVISLSIPGVSMPRDISPVDTLHAIATVPEDTPLVFTLRALSQQKKTIQLKLRKAPVYAPIVVRLLQHLPSQQSASSKQKAITVIIILIFISTTLGGFFRFLQDYLVRRSSYLAIAHIRQDAYKTAIRLPLTHFGQEGFSDTISRFVQDSRQIHAGLVILFGRTIREPVTILFLLVSALWINAHMTLIVMTGAPLAAIILDRLGRKMKKATRRALVSWSQMLSQLNQSFSGLRVVKGYHQESFEESRFSNANQKLLKQQYRMGKIDAISSPLLEVLGISAACVGMLFAARWLFDENQKLIDPTDFLALVFVLATIAQSGKKLGKVIPTIQTSNASAQRVFQLVDTPAETDPPQAKTIPSLKKSLEFQNLTFQYPNTNEPALKDINLSINAGEFIALVGPNGSGKTTLASLIPRFFLPQQGRILIDGTDIAQASLGSLRRQIGIVTQKTVVFNDTIADNIAYGNPEVPLEKIMDAAKQAYAHEFIEQTAQGYQTMIGEQGETLSGGQLQRIAIARAILANPAILIFDEATSQIDSDSEAKIQKALHHFAQGRTALVIAHRLSTIIHAHRIIVLDQGTLAAQGTHDQLIQSCPLYQKLYQSQFHL